ncbi:MULTISPECIES: helix-turn-helix domain-containing protein [Nitrosarchaeum]|jgi:DNA-binding HxlR family transcriptional regulator|uniref:HTH-type transcriptional regulator LrpC n=1 Tax=Nitrosarchaeum koreense MY1 TaxID=1001994 RepID=F9CV94_9ARCH|nr:MULTISPECIES: winged helix-turn-helix transcriptional regulator [Nitrosarchaeum]EGP93209.1 HTH-type transcriptional regulator LrpC [Nitrosarchaeum koreense MY1]MEC4847940.1 helix-turn-helix domain-containing protein [Nitrosarchaeum sp.]QLH10517.1 transcriptional regulator [Nitrosarchaeum sp. AC2]
METNRKKLPVIANKCEFDGYDVSKLLKETSTIRDLITKRATLEILFPLCCTTEPVRHKQFKKSLKGISSKTLSTRLSELVSEGILTRETFAEVPPRVEYRLTQKGQELIESITDLLNWMKKWSK